MNSSEENQQFKSQKPIYQEANFQIICAISLVVGQWAMGIKQVL